MTISQRAGTSSVAVGTGSVYVLDRWFTFRDTSGGAFSVQQDAGAVTPPAGFNDYLGITVTATDTFGSAGTQFQLAQFIEGFNTADLDYGKSTAKTTTLSFWVRSSLTGTFAGGIGNSDGTRGYVFTYSIPTANTWTYISVTIPGDTSGTWVGATNGIGLRVIYSLGTGSNFQATAGVWGSYAYNTSSAVRLLSTNGATFYITGVQLEVGTQATSFEYRQYGTELNLCQRYYYTTGNMANPTGTGGGFFGMPLAVALAFGQGNTSFRTTMRAVPTITLFDGNGVSGSVTQHGVADNIPSTAGGISQNGFMQVQRTSGSFSNSNAPITGGYTASIEL
jgi:hypothetical protein